MKKLFSTLLICTVTVVVTFSQTTYNRGFDAGYEAGYCYNDIGCLPPLPPIAPIPRIGENSNSYQDGYNRGFITGMEKKQKSYTRSGTSQGRQQPSNNYNQSLLNALELKTQQLQRQKAIEKEKAVAKMEQTRRYYSSFSNYPKKVANGWHNVIALNNYDFCEERKVYVMDSKIAKYVISNWLEKEVFMSGPINGGKGFITLNQDNGNTGDFIDIYFIDYLTNPNSRADKPIKPGKISFWTNWKQSASMKLYFEGLYVGNFKSYFEKGRPVCGQNGTLTVTWKPGTYRYKVTTEGGFVSRTWEGTITITEGGCSLQGLSKK